MNQTLRDVPADQYRIAVDRAGFGKSLPAAPLPSIAAQAKTLAPLLREGTIIVGYSFGGPIAIQMALDNPDKVAGIVLISCPADPELEHVHRLQWLAATSFISRLLPRELHSSNIELMRLKAELLALAGRIHQVSAKTTILQGKLDKLVHPENVGYLSNRLRGVAAPREIQVTEGGHYLPWTHGHVIEQAITYAIKDCNDLLF